jgi:hypothetical protein
MFSFLAVIATSIIGEAISKRMKKRNLTNRKSGHLADE